MSSWPKSALISIMAGSIALLAPFIILWFSKDRIIFGLPLGELGDFLSGTFGLSAIFFLMTAVFLQREELKLQREELILQRGELAANRQVLSAQEKELSKSAAAARTQTEILKSQQMMNEWNLIKGTLFIELHTMLPALYGPQALNSEREKS